MLSRDKKYNKHENLYNLEKHTFRTHKDTHTLYVLNNFCLSGHKKLTTSFTDSAVCLNTFFFSLQSEFTFFFYLKYKVQILWFPLLPTGEGRLFLLEAKSQLLA